MRHLDLFSGIGGFSLAVDWVWPDAEHIFVEIDPFCQKVLRKHWPDAKIYGDIKEFTGERIVADTAYNAKSIKLSTTDTTSVRCETRNGREPGVTSPEGRVQEPPPGDCGIDLSNSDVTNASSQRRQQECGSTPSHEGADEGRTTQDNYLSSRYHQSIDLLTGGFPCQPFSHAGKRHGTADTRWLWPEMFRVIRETNPTWVVAENVRGLLSQEGGLVFEGVCADLENIGYEVQPFIIPACAKGAPHRRDRVWIVAHGDSGRREQCNETVRAVSEPSAGDCHNPEAKPWGEDWYTVALRTCVRRVDDGVPRRVDRTNRLKALGNAIVPQVAYEIMLAIQKSEGQSRV